MLLPARRRPARHGFNQSIQKFLFGRAQAAQRNPLSAGSAVRSTFDLGADGDVGALPIDGLNLNDHSIAAARPAA